MDSDTKARRDKEDMKHTESLAATAKEKIYLSEVAGVAATKAFTAATLLYKSNDVGKLEACRYALVAAKQWIKSANATLKAAQHTEDMEAIDTAEEGLKLATTKAEESKQGVDQLGAVASLSAAAQAKIIQDNEIKSSNPRQGNVGGNQRNDRDGTRQHPCTG